MGYLFWKKRIKTSSVLRRQTPPVTLFDIKRDTSSYCFMMIANDLIIVYKDDTVEDENKAEKAFQECIAKGKIVKYENRKKGIIKYYNRYVGETSEPIPRVDYDILKDTIIRLQQKGIYNKRKTSKLKKTLYSVIFRLLKEGELGYIDNDMSGRQFISYLSNEDLKPGGHSNFYEYINKLKSKSRFPKWEFTNESFKNNKSVKLQDVISFAKDFVNTYKELKKSKNRTENRTNDNNI